MNTLVIGAGVVGCTTAYFLSKAGHDVVLLDSADGPAQGCSFANGGLVETSSVSAWLSPAVPKMVLRGIGDTTVPYQIRTYFNLYMWLWALQFLNNCSKKNSHRITENLRRLAQYSYSIMKAIGVEEKISYERRLGIIDLYRLQPEFDSALKKINSREITESRLLNRNDLIELVPALSKTRANFVGGLERKTAETGDAHLFASGITNAAEKYGVKTIFNCKVDYITMENSHVIGVKTNNGMLSGDTVVLCAGVGSRQLLKPLGIMLPIYPVKGYSVTVPARNTDLIPKSALFDHQQRSVILPLKNRLRITGFAEFDGYNRRINKQHAELLLNKLKNLLPDSADYRKPMFWCGLRPMTPNCSPIIGQTPIPGLYLNTGHGSNGWMLACGSSKIVADIISKKNSEISIEGFTFNS